MPQVICHDREGKEYKIDSKQLIFRPSVYGILIEDNKILLSKQWDGYDFPGGGIEIHETVEEALNREFFEETGLNIKRGKIVTCENSFFKFFYENTYANCFLIYYLCKKIGGQFSIANSDKNEKEYIGLPEWIDLNQIEKIKFYNSVDSVAIIKKAVAVKNNS